MNVSSQRPIRYIPLSDRDVKRTLHTLLNFRPNDTSWTEYKSDALLGNRIIPTSFFAIEMDTLPLKKRKPAFQNQTQNLLDTSLLGSFFPCK